MSQTSALQSLDLILEDVSAETNLAINSIEQYSRSNENSKALKKALTHLQKLKGVYTLLEMPGAQRLILDTIGLIKSLPKRKPSSRERLIGVAATSLARLLRYSEHINQKPYDLPQLLLPSINELRASANVPLLGEAVFFNVDPNKPRDDKSLVLLTSEESAKKSRHLRQMYQIGLIEVLRQTNLTGGLKMMQKAIEKLNVECPRPQSPNLWWISTALLQAYIDETLALTKPRLKLFSRLDRQIRKVENKSENLLEDNKLEIQLLSKEMLYLVSLSQSDSSQIVEVKAHFNIENSQISDRLLREEYEALRGPSDQDYQSIAEALLTEIDNIENTLKNSRDDVISKEDLKLALKQMVNLNNLLKILQVDDQAVRLTVAIDLVEKSLSDKDALTEKDFNILFIVLETIRKSVGQDDLAKYSGNSSVKKDKLNAAEKQFLSQTQQSVKKLMKSIIAFEKEDMNTKHLKSVSKELFEIEQGFSKLRVKQAKKIVDSCQTFVQKQLIEKTDSIHQDQLNLFADVIGSLEFYLETLSFTRTPSERILMFAENSLRELAKES